MTPRGDAAAAWGSERVDVAAYVHRTGYRGDLSPTVATLCALHRAHVGSIAFENLDIVLGRHIDLDIDALQDKLVRRGRGGYCFEHNVVFAAVLEQVGFTVTRLAGRIRMGRDRVRPRTHMTLRVEAGGRQWLADVGFGAEGLLEPLPVDGHGAVRQEGWAYRLAPPTGGTHVLQSRHGSAWFDLYSFTDEPQHPVDLETLNWFASTHPRSPFTRGVVVQQAGATVRRTLTRSVLTTVDAEGGTQRARLDDEAVLQALRHTFGLHLPADDVAALRAALAAGAR